ncbi:hypothetical protein HYC85_029394 [Camellia sinensis]|uniref:Uncharacterized protein n=1 Tax=Camellia sinensis TaxID=4442 RepID=A0A7J7FXV7_CAMSI|nr:hypothetical protein HYC85_029394 [Camellia sinensis]
MMLLDSCFMVELLRKNEMKKNPIAPERPDKPWWPEQPDKPSDKPGRPEQPDNNPGRPERPDRPDDKPDPAANFAGLNDPIDSATNQIDPMTAPIDRDDYIQNAILQDLVLFENQLPFFIVKKLFDMTIIENSTDSLDNRIGEFFMLFGWITLEPGKFLPDHLSINHLLGLLHYCCCYQFHSLGILPKYATGEYRQNRLHPNDLSQKDNTSAVVRPPREHSNDQGAALGPAKGRCALDPRELTRQLDPLPAQSKWQNMKKGSKPGSLHMSSKAYSMSTEYKLIADLPDSNKCAGDDYFIVSGNWEFPPDDDLHLYPLSRSVFTEGNALPQPPKDFRKTFFPSKDFKKLLGLPVKQRKAPLLVYKFTLPDVPKKSKSSTPSNNPSYHFVTTGLTKPQHLTQQSSHQHLLHNGFHLFNANAVAKFPSLLLQAELVTIATTADEIGRNKAVVENLLADIPGIVTVPIFTITIPTQTEAKKGKGPRQRPLLPKLSQKTQFQSQNLPRLRKQALLPRRGLQRLTPLKPLNQKSRGRTLQPPRAIQHAHSFAMQVEGMKNELCYSFLLQANPEAKAGEEEKEEDEDKEAKVVVDADGSAGAKSPTLNEQVLDLTQDEEDKVSKSPSPKKTTFEVPIAEKSLDQTLQEITPSSRQRGLPRRFHSCLLRPRHILPPTLSTEFLLIHLDILNRNSTEPDVGWRQVLDLRELELWSSMFSSRPRRLCTLLSTENSQAFFTKLKKGLALQVQDGLDLIWAHLKAPSDNQTVIVQAVLERHDCHLLAAPWYSVEHLIIPLGISPEAFILANSQSHQGIHPQWL